jgi:hypothetical protein
MSAIQTTSAEEVASLVSALRAWGIDYLTAGAARRPAPTIAPAPLLHRLADCQQARIRDAIISLLVLHPELAEVIPSALATADQETREQLSTLVLAALYLQRIWLTQLTLALGHPPQFPEALFAALWQARRLPPPALGYGEAGLRALEAEEQRRRGVSYHFSGDWQNQVQQLILQQWAAQRRAGHISHIVLPTPPSPWQEFGQEQGGAFMSLRPPVDRPAIERFLKRLGRIVHHPGRIYLVGGAALVHHQIRGPHASTLYIDLAFEGSDESEVESAIQQLKNELNLNVELASPGDFIPLPASWQRQAQYVGRYGALEVFYFDYYSLALSKIERGTERDLQDVALLAQQGWITRPNLDAAYQEILPQMGHGRYFNRDAARFAQQYAAAVQRAWADPPVENER